jgi:hypothetical protein
VFVDWAGQEYLKLFISWYMKEIGVCGLGRPGISKAVC